MSSPEPKRIYGIDLGTTYSCVSYIDKHGQPVAVRDPDTGLMLTPSVVYFQSDVDPTMPDEGRATVGEVAKAMAKTDPERVVKLVKRYMHDKDWSCDIDGKSYDPAQISGLILHHLAKEASQTLGEPVTDVVITVPAYFGPYERERTVQAGKLAGLVVHDILPEPMAAALYYGIDEVPEQQTVLVFDLGGGTFDVTVMQFSKQSKESLATKGDHDLGGNLWDEALARHWAAEIGDQIGRSGGDVWSDSQAREGLLLEAENAKKRLTKSPSTAATATYDGQQFTLRISLETFDALTAHLLARCEVLVNEAIAVATAKRPGLTIDTVLLVGGSTLMPQVRQRLKVQFGEGMRMMQTEPHLAVALGAANYAYQMQVKEYIKEMVQLMAERHGYSNAELKSLSPQQQRQVIDDAADKFGRSADVIADVIAPTFTDVSPRSFGIKHLLLDRPRDQHFVTNLVRVQQPMPASGSKVFSTIEANQAAVSIVCVENERDLGIDDAPVPFDPEEVIGEAALALSGRLPIHSPIELSIEFTSTGRVRVRGRDLTEGKTFEGEFRSKGLRDERQLAAGREQLRELTAVLAKD